MGANPVLSEEEEVWRLEVSGHRFDFQEEEGGACEQEARQLVTSFNVHASRQTSATHQTSSHSF